MKKPEQVIKLENLKNIAFILAKANLEKYGVYFCLIDGKRTQIIK